MHDDPIKQLTKEVQDALAGSEQLKDAMERAKQADGGETGTFDVVISTGDIDRHGERIDPDGMDFTAFKRNPVVLFGHNHVGLPVGTADEVGAETRDEKRVVRAKGRFAPGDANPMAQQVRRLFDAGILTTTSVGVLVHEIKIGDGDDEKTVGHDELKECGALNTEKVAGVINRDALKQKGILTKDDDVITLTKTELLEFSFVPVPANSFVEAIRENGMDVQELATKGIVIAAADGAGEGESPEADPTPEEGGETPENGENEQKTHDHDGAGYKCTAHKSPECRQDGETEEECRNRKIPEIMEENPDMEQDQAVAIASEMCKTPCSEKACKGAVRDEVEKPGDPVQQKIEKMQDVFKVIDALIEVYIFNEDAAVGDFDKHVAEAAQLLAEIANDTAGEKAATQRIIHDATTEKKEDTSKDLLAAYLTLRAARSKQDPDDPNAPEAVKKAGAIFNDLNERINDEMVQTSRKVLRLIGNALEGNDKAKDGTGGETDNNESEPAPDAGAGGESDTGGSGDDAGASAGEDAPQGGESPEQRSMPQGDPLEEAKTYFQVRDALRAATTGLSDALSVMNRNNPHRKGRHEK